jgi:hypothetical protein
LVAARPSRGLWGGVGASGWLAVPGVVEAPGAGGRVLAVVDFHSGAVGPGGRSRVGGPGYVGLG